LQLFPGSWERPALHLIISPLTSEERKMPVAVLGAAAIHAIIVIAGAGFYLAHLH
jgi:hypothetical protein